MARLTTEQKAYMENNLHLSDIQLAEKFTCSRQAIWNYRNKLSRPNGGKYADILSADPNVEYRPVVHKPKNIQRIDPGLGGEPDWDAMPIHRKTPPLSLDEFLKLLPNCTGFKPQNLLKRLAVKDRRNYNRIIYILEEAFAAQAEMEMMK